MKLMAKEEGGPVVISSRKKRILQEDSSPVAVTARKRQRSVAQRNLSLTPKPRRLSSKNYALSSEKAAKGRVVPTTPLKAEAESNAFLEHEIGMVYKIIRKQTGALGGNAAGGAIYGEITRKSFQRVIDFLKDNCEFTSQSKFIDIGSGLGKPNFHAAVDPGVAVSYGVELEVLRWHLSLHNLKSIVKSDLYKNKSNRVIFTAGDITDAKTFNPFTHVYSFDVGFPPAVMEYMAECFNRSTAPYLVSFHAPKKIIEMYGYHVTNVGRISTSMSGSSEGHLCYVYERTEKAANLSNDIDTLFKSGVEIMEEGNEAVLKWIANVSGENDSSSRQRRHARQARARKDPYQPSITSFCRTIPRISKENQSP